MTGTEPTSPKARILVVEDHAVVRDGFVALINREADLRVVAEAATAPAALAIMEKEPLDLVIADLTLKEGNGLDLIKTGRALYPDLHFLVISMQDEEVMAERCIKAGAGGYVMKQCATEEFLDAIRVILAGDIYFSKRMTARLLRRVSMNADDLRQSGLETLTDRELQVYQMLGAGMNTRDIAPQLGISPKTVATHRDNIKLKLGLKDTRALLQSAMRWIDHGGKS